MMDQSTTATLVTCFDRHFSELAQLLLLGQINHLLLLHVSQRDFWGMQVLQISSLTFNASMIS